MARQQSILLFMPWCKLDKTYTVGEIKLVPYTSGVTLHIVGIDSTEESSIHQVMGMYASEPWLNGISLDQLFRTYKNQTSFHY